MASSMVHIRVDGKIKAEAAETLAAMGLTVSDAVRLLLTRIAAEKAMPFEVKLPSQASHETMEAEGRDEGDSAAAAGPLQENLNQHEAHLVATGQMKLPKEEMDWDAFWALPTGNVPHDIAVQAVIHSRGDR